jgi:hypothetical protein
VVGGTRFVFPRCLTKSNNLQVSNVNVLQEEV